MRKKEESIMTIIAISLHRFINIHHGRTTNICPKEYNLASQTEPLLPLHYHQKQVNRFWLKVSLCSVNITYSLHTSHERMSFVFWDDFIALLKYTLEQHLLKLLHYFCMNV